MRTKINKEDSTTRTIRISKIHLDWLSYEGYSVSGFIRSRIQKEIDSKNEKHENELNLMVTEKLKELEEEEKD